MNPKVSFTPAAQSEVVEAFDWYEAHAAGLGAAFLNEVERQVARLAENPLQFPALLQDVRRARLRRFPYSLFFRMLENGQVFVIACFHASRDPRKWEHRS
ncbi:MAG: type II toxin-antitoxin system RelE/ParE family toxin [Hyphomonadaceae bacterium]|nr:type II toxin-antitoxin system RelE/ParE family toxin [Hyphomonadaceae bacterium]